MLTSSGGGGGGGGRSMLTVADRGRGDKICQNLADVICERSHNNTIRLTIQHKARRAHYLCLQVVSAALYCIVRRIVLLRCLYTGVTGRPYDDNLIQSYKRGPHLRYTLYS